MTTWQGKTCVRLDIEQTYTLNISQLVPRLKIPSFQRGYVWSVTDALALMDSIALGYPIGSIVLWDHKNEGWGLSTGDLIVLDGQQRLSTLAGVILPGGFGDVVRIAYDVGVDAFVALAGDPTPDQILISDLGNVHKLSQFWMALADRHSVVSQVSDAELWEKIAPGIPFPGTKAARKKYSKQLQSLETEITAHKNAQLKAWEAAHPWIRKLEFVERRLRDHRTPVTVIRGGSMEDVREIFRRLNTAGRPLNEKGVLALLEGS